MRFTPIGVLALAIAFVALLCLLGAMVTTADAAQSSAVDKRIAAACEESPAPGACMEQLTRTAQLRTMLGNRGYANKMCEHPCRDVSAEYYETCKQVCVDQIIN